MKKARRKYEEARAELIKSIQSCKHKWVKCGHNVDEYKCTKCSMHLSECPHDWKLDDPGNIATCQICGFAYYAGF